MVQSVFMGFVLVAAAGEFHWRCVGKVRVSGMGREDKRDVSRRLAMKKRRIIEQGIGLKQDFFPPQDGRVLAR